MAETNIQVFNAAQNNALGDSEYTNCEERRNGFLGLLARSVVFNKFCFQVSAVCKAVADFINSRGLNAFDYDIQSFSKNLTQAIISLVDETVNDRVPHSRQPGKQYFKGDIVTHSSLPTWAELQCIVEGETEQRSLTVFLPPITAIGQQIQDGSVLWALRSKRFVLPVNVPTPFSGDFQEVVAGFDSRYFVPIDPDTELPLIDCRLCDGTQGTADMRERFLLGSNIDNAGKTGGQDFFTISRNNLPTETFSGSVTTATTTLQPSATFQTSTESSAHSHELYFSSVGGPAYGGLGAYTNYGGTAQPSQTANHTHNVAVSFDLTHAHAGTASFSLNNTGTITPISTISKHKKITFIQRIY